MDFNYLDLLSDREKKDIEGCLLVYRDIKVPCYLDKSSTRSLIMIIKDGVVLGDLFFIFNSENKCRLHRLNWYNDL